MKVYEARIQYSVVRRGRHESLKKPAKIVEYMRGAFDDMPLNECFYVVCLNRKDRPICRTRLSVGTVNSTLVGIMEIFRAAVLASASGIVCVHQHPSGDPSPSSADVAITRRIRRAGEVMDIPLIDHVVIGTIEDDPKGKGYYSFAEARAM
jgi:DNA repair proteins